MGALITFILILWFVGLIVGGIIWVLSNWGDIMKDDKNDFSKDNVNTPTTSF